jgi:large subunit ribosomal protein L9
MKVILLSDIYKHGVAGEVVDVADGFARNYLIPKKLAVQATPGALKQAEKLRAASAARKAALEGRLNDLARQINGVELIFERRASPTGKLFGSVTTSEIAEALLEKTGLDINRRRISQTNIRELGTHDVPVRLGSEESPLLKVTIVREGGKQAYLAAQAAAQAESAVVEVQIDPDTAALAGVSESSDAVVETGETAAE